ncbi:MAG TPA: TylF/MycF/NovP-related O-methyltransferase [Aliidongia sp.]|nr:TylF/MycF/NovP-related O-methyltransferase [Aliidongia sp.]
MSFSGDKTAAASPAPNVVGNAAAPERSARGELMGLLARTPIPQDELVHNLGLYLTRQTLSRILYMADLYRQIVEVHGVVMEFGVRWGQNLSLFSALRGIHEPFNYNRKIVGFDTFAGFPAVDAADGTAVRAGDYGVTEGFERHLDQVLQIHESLSPVSHIKKYELVKGDATVTIGDYLGRQPETIVALAYFDFDIYKPTKACLEAVLPRMAKGGILAFDELNCPQFPGETLAVLETIGLQRYPLRRSPLNPLCSYMRVE